MSYLLDTNTASGLMKGRRAVIAHMRRKSRAELAMSTIVMSELWFGAFKSPQASQWIAKVEALRIKVPGMLTAASPWWQVLHNTGGLEAVSRQVLAASRLSNYVG